MTQVVVPLNSSRIWTSWSNQVSFHERGQNEQAKEAPTRPVHTGEGSRQNISASYVSACLASTSDVDQLFIELNKKDPKAARSLCNPAWETL